MAIRNVEAKVLRVQLFNWIPVISYEEVRAPLSRSGEDRIVPHAYYVKRFYWTKWNALREAKRRAVTDLDGLEGNF